jgi:predicted ATPase/class 3 adenylate cyclase
MDHLPTGTVTFLLTDVEGSTRLWDAHPEATRAAVARHDSLAASVIAAHEGVLVKSRGEGDSLFATFGRAADAVVAAVALQEALVVEEWPTPVSLRVRMALHTGEADLREGDYYGAAVNRCARLRAAAHGGQVLLSGATRGLVQDCLPEGVSLRDLGLHRLRDLAQPEQIYLLHHPALPEVDAPLRSLQAFSHNLPLQLTSFIGRERELAEVKRLLAGAPAGPPLVTLTGAGGTGKTRLSLQVAADLLEEYEDGVWLVQLAALSDPALVPQAVAAVLGVAEEPGKALTQSLAEYLRPKRVLLLLDNCEHLLAACAAVADALLRSCPQVRVLASSREALGIAGEQTYRVPSLSVPDAKRLPPLARLTKFEAVRLFADRAALGQPTFAITEQNAPVVVHVCQRLDGIPLAIELAAARVKALPVEQIAARLDDCFRLLTGGSRMALPRQQTLRATMDWSYHLLSEPERAMLRRLSVFAGGWSLEAAEQVTCDEVGGRASGGAPTGGGSRIEAFEVLDLLTQLVEKSLVVYGEQEGEARYRLAETVRQYGRERLLEMGEAAVLRGRHRDWFAALAERAGPELFGSEQPVWVRRLEREHDNLRAAMAWAVESGGAEVGLRMGGSLWRFWHIRGYAEEGREWLAAALSREGASERTRVRAQALDGAGVLALRAARTMGVEAANAHYQEMLAIGRELEDGQIISTALNGLGHTALLGGDGGRARPLLEQGLGLAREVGHPWEAAFALHCLGFLFVLQGDDDAAWPLLEESLGIRREHGDRWGLYWTLLVMAILAERQDNHAVARALLEECVAICREFGKVPELVALRGLANAARVQGDVAAARAGYDEMRAIAQERGDRAALAESLFGVGSVAISQGELGAAYTLFDESLGIGRELGEEWLVAASLEGLGEVARYQGDDAAACAFHEQCLAMWRAGEPEGTGSSPIYHFKVWPLTAGGSVLGLGRLAQKQGDAERAAALYREGLARYREKRRKPELAKGMEALGSLAVAQGQPERAARLFGAADALREAAGAPMPPVERGDYQREVAAVLAALGKDTFATAWAAGRAMTLEQAIASALHESAAAGARARPARLDR